VLNAFTGATPSLSEFSFLAGAKIDKKHYLGAIFQHDEGVDDRASETEELPPKGSKAAAKPKAKPKVKTKKTVSRKRVDKGRNEAVGKLTLASAVEKLSAEKFAVSSSFTSLGPRAAPDAGEDSTGKGLEVGAQVSVLF
jgi:hypothetical protein